jgi:LacI family transcriptional regulator
MAADHLLSLGLRHFGFAGYANYPFSQEREAGFRQALVDRALSFSTYHERTLVAFDPAGHLWALDAQVRRWVESLPKPAGIFAANDVWGVQLVELCRQAGFRVPEDVALLGVDNDDLLCELARPSLSSISVPAGQIGFEAAATLHRLLSGRRAAKSALFPPVRVVARQSSDLLALDDPDVAAALQLIRRSERPLQVLDVLKTVPVSRRALERRFAAHVGRGIGEEIRRVRLERAKELLARTMLPMTAVADRAGYSAVTRLCVAFRQATGQTPAAYRRRYREGGAMTPGSERS